MTITKETAIELAKEAGIQTYLKPHQCPRCFGLFAVGDRYWNDEGTVYHWICWVNKSKEKTDDVAGIVNRAITENKELK